MGIIVPQYKGIFVPPFIGTGIPANDNHGKDNQLIDSQDYLKDNPLDVQTSRNAYALANKTSLLNVLLLAIIPDRGVVNQYKLSKSL